MTTTILHRGVHDLIKDLAIPQPKTYEAFRRLDATADKLATFASTLELARSKKLPWFDVKEDFGARGDGLSDDTESIEHALAAAAIASYDTTSYTVGAVVVFPPGIYSISRTIYISKMVSVIGFGFVLLRAISAMTVMVDRTVAAGDPSYYGTRTGITEDITLDGNELANNGWRIGQITQHTFRRLTAFHCTTAGMLIDNTQNCLFDSCDLEQNGTNSAGFDAGMIINHGAANNAFVRCELADNGRYQLMLISDAAVPDGVDFNTVPNLNSFYKCQFEQHNAVAAPRCDLENSIIILGGAANIFDNCNISQIFPPSGTTRNVIRLLTSNNSSTVVNGNQWKSCNIQGSNTGSFLTRAIQAGAGSAPFAVFTDTFENCFFNSHLSIAHIDDFSTIEIFRPAGVANITNLFTNFGGTNTVDQCVNLNRPERYKVFFSAARGISIGAPNIDSLNCFIISGNGTPEAAVAAPVGSLFLRANGGAGTSLYVKEGGGTGNTGWVGK